MLLRNEIVISNIVNQSVKSGGGVVKVVHTRRTGADQTSVPVFFVASLAWRQVYPNRLLTTEDFYFIEQLSRPTLVIVRHDTFVNRQEFVGIVEFATSQSNGWLASFQLLRLRATGLKKVSDLFFSETFFRKKVSFFQEKKVYEIYIHVKSWISTEVAE